MKSKFKAGLGVFLAGVFLATASYAKLPSGFKETLVVKGLVAPVTFAFAPDGRIFICEQNGEVKIFKDGVLKTELFLKLEVDSQGEHGVLGIAFDPSFETHPYVYIYYTALSPLIHNRLSRFTVEGDHAKEGSELVLLELDDLKGSIFHSAGGLRFGPDGKLYVGVGDNAKRPDPNNAQILTNPFGKILRINSDGTIPADNPFYQAASGIYRAIWAMGFRNPFTISFQAGTNRLFVNDVGANNWEEINEAVAGGNFGWPEYEGQSSDPRFIPPVFTYAHGPITDETMGCAVTGGVFYNPIVPQFPESYVGKYFFTDYCNKWLHVLDSHDHSVTVFGKDISPNPISLQLGDDGSLYYISRWFRSIHRISYKPTKFY